MTDSQAAQAASIRARLLNISREQQVDFNRMKDFYDIWAICQFMNPDQKVLATAIANTFARRGTVLPTDTPLALTDEFSANAIKQKQWIAFVRRAAVAKNARQTLQETVADIRPFLMQTLF